MRLKTLIKTVAVLLLVIVAALGLFLKSLDFNDYKDLLQEQVRAATGRDLVIRGDVELDLFPTPTLALRDITFSNAPWGSRPNMMRLKRMEMKVRVLPLLSGRVMVRRLVFSEPDIFLETDNRGKGNWSFAKDRAKKESPAIASRSHGRRETLVPFIHEVHMEKGLLRFRDGGSGRTWILSLNRLRGSARDEVSPMRLTIDGAIHHHPFQVDASLGPLSRQPSALFPVQLKARAMESVLKIEGTIAHPLAGKGLRLNFSAEGPSLAPLARAAGLETVPQGPFRLAGRISDSNGTYALEDIRASLGESRLAGAVTVHTGGKRVLVAAEVQDLEVDGDALAAMLGPGKRPAKTGDMPKAKAGSGGPGLRRIFSNAPLHLDFLQTADLSLNLDRGRIHARGVTLEHLRSSLDLLDGRLQVHSLRGSLAGGGNLDGDLHLDASQPMVGLKSRVDMKGIPVGSLLKAMKITDLVSGGEVRVHARLHAGGKSIRELMAGLNGEISLAMRKGTLKNQYLDFAAADLARLLVPGGTKKDRTAVNCFVCRFDIKEGLATNRGLLLDTGAITVAGKGQVNLGDESLDLLLKPRPKRISLLSLAMPVRVRGVLAEPRIRPDALGVIKGVAGALLGAAVPGPAGLLVPLVAKGTGDENPCIAALKGSDTRPKTGKKD